MKAFVEHRGLAALLNRCDVDTDQIIPKQFLKKIGRSGFGRHLFHDWRFLDEAGVRPNPDFVLNKQRYKGASVLVTGKNFGCGSSREHAPWALEDYGFRALLAPSFADIFYSNCMKIGLLPVKLEEKDMRHITSYIEEHEGASIKIDLRRQEVHAASFSCHFAIEAFHKENLLQGKDEIGLALEKQAEIGRFEERHFARFPYLCIKMPQA